MQRRTFLKNTSLAAGTLLSPMAAMAAEDHEAAQPFQLNYAPHIGMFAQSAGKDPIAQIHYMADQGFRAFEDNEMRNRSLSLQEAMAKALKARSMQMGVFVAHQINWSEPSLTTGDEAVREAFLQDIRDSVAIAKRVGATWMTVVPGLADTRQDVGYQTANLVESLRRASEILEPHELVMVLEPLNFRDHPGLFLTKAAQAYQICRAVDSPACKILFDIYHLQIQEGNLLPNIERCWEEIAYFQIGDNPGRNEPTTGEINYKNMFKYIHSRGFTGILGMEHGNAQEGKAGEAAVVEAYREVDRF
jgi:hydroxypyruvate isomerase